MRFLALAVLLALPAFFAAAEVALLRLRPSRVSILIDERTRGARAVQRLQRRLRRTLIVSQLGTALSLLALGWVGRNLGEQLWPSMIVNGSRWWDAMLFLVLVALATLLAGLLPRAWVLSHPELAALRLAPLLESALQVMMPLVILLETLASLLFRLVGLRNGWDALMPVLTASELETLIESGGVTGLRPDERNILEGVFSLRDTQVREVMVPRSGMVTLPVSVRFHELMHAVHCTRHARFPVIGGSLDDVRGVLDLRRLAEPISRGELSANSSLEPYLLPAVRVLETETLEELLTRIRSGHPFLLVVDEHGGTEGLVTTADLNGEIVGEEIKPGDNETDLQPVDGQPGLWMLAGDLEIFELNRQLGLHLPEAHDHHTLAGFLLEKLQHIPTPGEALQHEGMRFEISEMHGPRIQRVRLILPRVHHMDS